MLMVLVFQNLVLRFPGKYLHLTTFDLNNIVSEKEYTLYGPNRPLSIY